MPYWQPANNQVPSVADWVSYVADQVIAQITSGTRPSGTSMQIVGETDTGRFQGFDGSGWVGFGGLTAAAFTGHTPQIDQGVTNIAKTTNYSQFQRLGNVLWWGWSFSFTAAGTTNNQVTLTSPATAVSQFPGVGGGRFFDASATQAYPGIMIPSSTATVRLFVTGAASTALGQSPNIPVTSGDSMQGHCWLPLA